MRHSTALQGIDRFNTLEIPTYVPSAIWDCNQCLQFANALFAFIRLNTVAGMRYTLAYNSDQVKCSLLPCLPFSSPPP